MLRFIISVFSCIALVWLLNSPIQFGSTSIPPIGKIFSPSHGFWANADKDKYLDRAMRVRDLDADLNIVFDQRLVPHIFAKSDRDLYFAQGYVTAMNRLWQLDITSRSAAGRISEVVGESALDYDKSQRRMGLAYAAEKTIEFWEKDQESMEMLDAYTEGINAYISRLKPRNYPLEFKLMNYKPEEWSTYKCALFVKSMCVTLCSFEKDLEFSNMLEKLGKEPFNQLFPEINNNQDPIIPKGTKWNFEPIEAPIAESIGIPQSAIYNNINPSEDVYQVGSNDWAVSGSKTKSGNPILCNDPHLSLSLPSIWYEIHLNSPEQNCYGVSLPGMPCVISGFNDDAAWGMTNVGHDVLDWYQVKWVDTNKTRYELDNKVLDVTYRYETIKLANGDSVIDTVKYTHWGPVMSDGTHKDLAMRWIAHDVGPLPDPMTFNKLDKAKNVNDFKEAMKYYHAPAQNFVFADRSNNIALGIGGSLPLRPEGQGALVSDGARTANGWKGFIPPEHNPISVNPERGFVSSANQRTTDESYPYYYTSGSFEDYRGNTLNRYLASMNNITRNDMQQLQQSNYSLKVEQILPLMLEATNGIAVSTTETKILNALKTWGYNYNADDIEPTYFELWYNKVFYNTWDEFEGIPDSISHTYPNSWKLIELALHYPDTSYFDMIETTDDESFGDIVILSLEEAAKEFDELASDKRTWSKYRNTTIQHLANLPGMSITLDNTPGHGDALNAIRERNGPSWRMIVELNDPIVAHAIYPGGESGSPGSKFYDNSLEDWVAGKYYKLEFTDSLQTINALYSLTIEKKGK